MICLINLPYCVPGLNLKRFDLPCWGKVCHSTFGLYIICYYFNKVRKFFFLFSSPSSRVGCFYACHISMLTFNLAFTFSIFRGLEVNGAYSDVHL